MTRPAPDPDPSALLLRVDTYLDAVPRTAAAPEDVGPFTLFRSLAPWPYYARPRPAAAPDPVSAADVAELAARCDALGLPLALEWVVQRTPALADVARAAGLEVLTHPLMAVTAATFVPAPAPDGVRVVVVGPDDPDLLAGRAVADTAFGAPGTAVGSGGPAERDAARAAVSPETAAFLQARAATGLSVTAVAVDAGDGVVGVGTHQPVDDVSEVVGVGTLPAHRRRGLAAAVTAVLVADAFARGVELVVLSADDDDVARVYARLGFTRLGETGAAERPKPPLRA